MTTQNTLLNSQHNSAEAIVSPQFSKEQINALHQEFQAYGKNAKHWIRKCQLLLPKIRDEEVWKKKGFSSIYEYAAKLAGMSHNSVNEALRVLDKIEDKPLIREKVEKYGVNRVAPVVRMVTKETQEFWANKVEKMSLHTLKTYVREHKLKYGLVDQGQRIEDREGCMSNDVKVMQGKVSTSEKSQPSTSPKISMYMKLDVEVIEQLKKLKGNRDWNEVIKDLLEGGVQVEQEGESKDVMSVDQSSVTNSPEEIPQPVNTGKRYVPAKIRKHVIKKTSGCCAYPGCTKPYEILHHTKRFALDSTHDPMTLQPLCKAHERIAHAGLIENEESIPVQQLVSNKSVDAQGSKEIRLNWNIRKEPDIDDSKYQIDKKVQDYYMKWI